MPYILNKTDGTVITIVQDASTDNTTDLVFVGRNYAGYGEIQNENFLKLLENFSNVIGPPKPIAGQTWFDTNSGNKKLNVYDGTGWKTVANLEVSSANPSTSPIKFPKQGDLWFSTQEQQLNVFNGSEYILIGPSIGADTQAGWRGDFEISQEEGTGIRKYNIKSVIGTDNDVVSVVSADTFTVIVDNNDSSKFQAYAPGSKVYRGINLVGADPITGNSETEGIYFWGTAAHARHASSATTATNLLSTVRSSTNSQPHYVSFVSSLAGNSPNYTSSTFTYNPGTRILYAPEFSGISTRARYADLAERYSSDRPYQPGTVVIIGGTAEITACKVRADTAVAGIISKNPGYMMNAEAGPDSSHPYVALKGRVECFVVGNIKKGDMLVTSRHFGHAEAWKQGDSPSAVFARALQDFSGDVGIIEVKI